MNTYIIPLYFNNSDTEYLNLESKHYDYFITIIAENIYDAEEELKEYLSQFYAKKEITISARRNWDIYHEELEIPKMLCSYDYKYVIIENALKRLEKNKLKKNIA